MDQKIEKNNKAINIIMLQSGINGYRKAFQARANADREIRDKR